MAADVVGDGSLVGLSLLLVRPGLGNDQFSQLASGQGAHVHHHPVMRIAETSEKLNSDLLRKADMLIFVSRTAVIQTVTKLQSLGLVLPIDVPCFAVGRSTALSLSEFGINAVVPNSQMTSEGLLELPQLQKVKGKNVTIFAGEGGRDLLESTLVRRGAQVSKVALYRRAKSFDEAESICRKLLSGEFELIVVHSGELLENLLTIVESAEQSASVKLCLLDLPILVPGIRVAESARLAKINTVITAESALPDDMVSALLRWYSKA